jgi:uncharacterized protein
MLRTSAERFAYDGCPGLVVATTCGSLLPGSKYYDESEDGERRYLKESKRIFTVLQQAQRLMQPGDTLALALHYPPFAQLTKPSVYTQAIEEYGVSLCVFGHIHTRSEHERVLQGDIEGCLYRLVAADYLDMTPAHIGSLSEQGFSFTR